MGVGEDILSIMDNNVTHLFASDVVQPTRVGIVHTSDTGCVVFAVYDLKDRPELVEEWAMDVPRDTQFDRLATHLSGLYRDYNGPGRGFAGAPSGKLYGRKLLVTQFRGVDC